MSATTDPSIDAPAGDEVVSTRVFAAPRGRVFAAFTDPDTLARWWGPKGFTNTFHHFDPRPGGTWRFAMHGPDGKTWDLTKRFVEIVPDERIVFDHVEPMHTFRMTMTYADAPGSSGSDATRLTWWMRFTDSPTAKRRAFIAAANEENFDRLQAVLGDSGVTDRATSEHDA